MSREYGNPRWTGSRGLPGFAPPRSPGVLLLALIVLLGVGGYLLTSTTIRRDRDEAAERRARVEAVQTQEVLGRARAYVDGLAAVLAQEPEPGQARFARWAGATSASVGLNDVLWVERVPASERRRYERRRGVPITRLTASGPLRPRPGRALVSARHVHEREPPGAAPGRRRERLPRTRRRDPRSRADLRRRREQAGSARGGARLLPARGRHLRARSRQSRLPRRVRSARLVQHHARRRPATLRHQRGRAADRGAARLGPSRARASRCSAATGAST